MPQSKKVNKSLKQIIFGASGFIGSHLFKSLKSLDSQVVGFSSKDLNLANEQCLIQLEKILDLNTIIFFCSSLTREKGDNLSTFEKNFKMAKHLAQVLERKKIKKCLFLSSTDIYGLPEKLPINEKTPPNPQTHYGASKYISEKILEFACQVSQVQLICLRFSGVYGPGQKNLGYGLNYFLDSILNQKNVSIWGEGEELRDPIYVKDLAQIISELSFSNFSGVINIASGDSLSFKEQLSLLKKIVPFKFDVKKKTRTKKSFDQIFDISLLKALLPHFEFTPREKSYQETLSSWQKES